MAELRRLFIEPNRIAEIKSIDVFLRLEEHEVHYLKRVLRLRPGESIAVVDGIGHLWTASLQTGGFIKLDTPFSVPNETKVKSTPLIGLGVVVPRRGFEEVLRMGSELGVDYFQPLYSHRSSPQVIAKPARWESIIREASEQSERLWKPQLFNSLDVSSWWGSFPSRSALAFATTRKSGLQHYQEWIKGLPARTDQVCIAIGPEGGWTPSEEDLAQLNGWIPVDLGDNILRTCTASVAAAQLMGLWKSTKSLGDRSHK